MPLCTGDLRNELGKELMASIEKVINDNANKHDEYYILIHSDWDHAQPGILRTKLMLMLESPYRGEPGTGPGAEGGDSAEHRYSGSE